MSSSTVEVTDSDRLILESWTRSSTVSAGRVQRARIVLATAEGAGTTAVANRLGISRPTVIKWRDRFAESGIAGLDDEPRSGRPKAVDDAAILAATLEPPAEHLAVTHWSTRLLAGQLGIGDATVARAWRKYGIKPWRRETFKFSTDPELEAKIRDVVGLYLNPPTNAIVLCVDEKSQIQALNRTAPILPVRARQGRVRRLPAQGGQGLPGPGTARRGRQLPHPQTRRDPGLAGQEPADHAALHPHLRVVAESGRGVLRDHHPTSSSDAAASTTSPNS